MTKYFQFLVSHLAYLNTKLPSVPATPTYNPQIELEAAKNLVYGWLVTACESAQQFEGSEGDAELKKFMLMVNATGLLQINIEGYFRDLTIEALMLDDAKKSGSTDGSDRETSNK